MGSPSGWVLIVVALALPAAAGVDLLGWLAAPQVWLEAGKAVQPISKAYAGVPAAVSLLATFAFILAIVSLGAYLLGLELRKFVPAFTVVFVDQRRLLAGRAITPTSRRRRTSVRRWGSRGRWA